MIYVIESTGLDYNDNTTKTYLKIGFSEDSNFKKRLDSYELHNPFHKLLYKIPNGTKNHEKYLYSLFLKYRVYRNEWFLKNQEILEYFEDHKTVESINLETINPVYARKDCRGTSELKRSVIEIIDRYYNRQFDESRVVQVLKELDKELDKYIPEIGKSITSLEQFKDIFGRDKVYEDTKDTLPDNISKFLGNFNSLSQFSEKLRFLCETVFSENEINLILDQIPLSYKSYYNVLGPTRCKALKYRKCELDEEISLQKFDISDVKREIQMTFQVGEIYLRKDIKDKLSEIYKNFGYSRSPKATDLEEYFEMQKCKKQVNKIRQECFKIIKKL